MKKLILVLSMCVLFAVPARSQVIVDILNNTILNNYNYAPGPTFYGYYNAFYMDQLYTASELIAAGAPVGGGKIPAISLYPTYMYNYSGGPPPLQIKMAHTSATQTHTVDFYAYMPPLPPRMSRWDETTVYQTTAFASPTTTFNWWRIPFDDVFVWDGVSNIIVTYCFSMQNHVAYPNYSNFFYVRGGYSPNYGRMVDLTYWYGASASYNLPPADWCESPPEQSPPLYQPPYYEGYRYSSRYTMREDMRFEICNQDPLLYSLDPPGMHFLPGSIPVVYSVGRASGTFTATVTINLYRPDGSFVKNEVFQVPIDSDVKTGTYMYSMAGVPAGFYRVEAVFNGLDECGNMFDHYTNHSIMILDPGSTPCEVWPGDVTNDGIVNYGDRAALNQYIYEANMRAMWLQGPARYRVDMDTNPLTYLTWDAQYSVPWQTVNGCYMDSDGNGVVNNFDYIAIKMNWNRAHSAVAPKQGGSVTATFSVGQNYPNPFNPTTAIDYTLPERSEVVMHVFDMFGRQVATLVDGSIEAGSHTVHFDAAALSSGQYIARVNMSGLETGFTFSKTIRMTLSK